jgi:hypothetical protein
VHPAAAAAAPRQRDVQGFLAEAGFELLQLQVCAPGIERGLDALDGGVVVLSRRFSLLGGKRSQGRAKGRKLPRLAEVFRLGVL